MISYPAKTRAELKIILDYERDLYCPKKSYRKHLIRYSKPYSVYNALRKFRQYEFIILNNKHNPVIRLLIERRLNRLLESLGFEFSPGNIEPGMRICHNNVILNGYAGKDCIFHGNNMIGNKKTGQKNSVPRIGNNVDIGYGAIIIGDVRIADNCIVGAGAVVTKSFDIPGSVIAGVPARLIKEIGDMA